MRRVKSFECYLQIVVILILVISGNVIAQEDVSDETKEAIKKELVEKYRERLDKIITGEVKLDGGKEKTNGDTEESDLVDPMIPEAPSTLFSDKLTQEKYLAALQEYYNYRIEGLKHRKNVFKWQLLSSKVIFVVVLLLVLSGIYFAAVQFHAGLGRKAGVASGEGEEKTELEASLKGIKVSSPVLGVIILVISLAFFYLYLVYVYPIEDIF